MEDIELICLAISRKNGGKCVAGIDTKTGKWVRPVNSGGEDLSYNDIKFEDNTTPKLLDIIGVSVFKKEPLYFQPENVIIDPGYYWYKTGEYKIPNLKKYCGKEEYIFLDDSDRLTEEEAEEVGHSLVLVNLTRVNFVKMDKYNGRGQKIRAQFTYKGHRYDLVVTDRDWERHFNDLHYGEYLFNGNFFLTISLGTLFNGYHYKLVASVICEKSFGELLLDSILV